MRKPIFLAICGIVGATVILAVVISGLTPRISRAVASPSVFATKIYRELELFGKSFATIERDYIHNEKKLIASAIDNVTKRSCWR